MSSVNGDVDCRIIWCNLFNQILPSNVYHNMFWSVSWRRLEESVVANVQPRNIVSIQKVYFGMSVTAIKDDSGPDGLNAATLPVINTSWLSILTDHYNMNWPLKSKKYPTTISPTPTQGSVGRQRDKRLVILWCVWCWRWSSSQRWVTAWRVTHECLQRHGPRTHSLTDERNNEKGKIERGGGHAKPEWCNTTEEK